ncbi:MAG: ATP-binding cassette domain-containing protein [Holosporales bacterium]|jgi:ATPase subunit of ABC transporter with duplicated ATPase domains|nr:ATP-binding cassette domain-containing protein [Holosporales bacterium]
MPRPVVLKTLSVSFPHKVCFEDFSAIITPGDRIAVIGRNGSGKSSLLKMIAACSSDVLFAYIPQIITDFPELSGGERFNKALSLALGQRPSLLLLDEPTNHLDTKNRKGLWRMLRDYKGTLVVATHDKELLRCNVDILWHIDGGKITVFRGKYDAYMNEIRHYRYSLVRQMEMLEREKKSLHQDLIRTQERSAKSCAVGKKKIATRRWMKSVGDLKAMKAQKSQSSRFATIDNRKQEVSAQLESLSLPETIHPTFSLTHQEIADKTLVSVIDGMVGYKSEEILLKNITFSVRTRERVALVGSNGCGKTTLMRAILGDVQVVRRGEWRVPSIEDIGYLDQHYDNLNKNKTVFESIALVRPLWTHAEIRKHLNDFLFRKSEEVQASIHTLSGGEKVRLSLAQIAAHPPKLLLLDEITNNIDLETRDHLISVLRMCPIAMLIVSHDEGFLKEIEIEKYHEL